MKYAEIKIKGMINTDWSDWFNGLQIRHITGDSLLQGAVADMAAVYGVIDKLKNLGMEIISVNVTDAEEP